MKKYLFAGALLTITGLCPVNAISRELSARQTIIAYLSVSFCMIEEGVLTKKQAINKTYKALREIEGISAEKIEVIMGDEDLHKLIQNWIDTSGGCVKMIKDFAKTTPDNKK